MKVLVTAELPEVGMECLRREHEVILETGGRDAVLARLPEVDGLVCLLSDTVGTDWMEAGKRLRVISVYAAGTNNVDIQAAQARGIAVTNTPDVLTEATADLALLLILGITRRLDEGVRMMVNRQFSGWAPDLLLGRELSALNVGIFGAGRIGRAVMRKLSVFGPRVIYCNRSGPHPEADRWGQHVDFKELLSQSDLLSLHAPLTEKTRHLFQRELFKDLKRRPFIVNTARGPLIREKDLVEALREGWVSGAALDVFEFEPKVTDELYAMERVLLLPHLGSATRETRDAMAVLAAENTIAILAGKHCPNRVV